MVNKGCDVFFNIARHLVLGDEELMRVNQQHSEKKSYLFRKARKRTYR